MTSIKIFPRGGVNPPDSSLISRRAPIVNAAVPSIAVIPLLQHAGSPARCVVKPGDPVREGMLLGAAQGAHSANVHSSIPGRVVEVVPTGARGGVSCQAVVIELGGEFETSGKPRRELAWEGLSRADLLRRIQSAGVVGLGGELVPTHLKLAMPPGRTVALLVANGMDCEPSMSADYALMREKTREISEALRICRALLEAPRVVLAMAEHAEDLVPEFERAFRESGVPFEIVLLPSRYPAGYEQTVLSGLDGSAPHTPPSPRRATGADSVRRATGADSSSSVVLNVATLHAVYEAVVLDKPLIERVLTVTGAPVAEPRNLKVRLGTRVGDLFEECGGLASEPGKIVLGGPMRGVAIDSMDVPVTKGTFGVMAFARAEARTPREFPCIRCGSCVEACPWDLVPTRLYKLIRQGDLEAAEREGLSRCTECGCCAYACPSHIPLVSVLRSAKKDRERSARG